MQHAQLPWHQNVDADRAMNVQADPVSTVDGQGGVDCLLFNNQADIECLLVAKAILHL